MDKGAHFYKCDFQVHTPRDINWNGQEATNEEDRKAYAEEFIRACREKSLDAVAITDHHDFAFFPYIRKAAQNELDDSGQPVSAEKQIMIFPGIEMTLTSPTCQALLILDSNFPDNLLASALTALSITPAAPENSKTAPTQRITNEVISSLSNLYDKLNSHEHIKGRFIVLPNVSEGGNATLLRSGFHNFYTSMPCVGGYTDGPVSQFGTGNLSIVNGEKREYGFKSIAVFQTSDNRNRSYEDLGKHTTWVKWSEPTAEALRQACLAKESRMSQDEPELPSLWITSVSVSHSKFLGRVELDLNQQYNAIIGGRGTGKSTILEYLRWGLCDQPVENYDSDIAPVHTKRKKLIDDTLQKYDGEVHVTFFLNRVKHMVKRNSTTQEILLKIGEGNFVPTTEQEIRNLLPIQAYSQKQLSNVGVRIEELKRFVELPVKKTIDQIRSDIRDTAVKIRAAYGNLIRKEEIEAEINKYNIEVASLAQQLDGLRAGLQGLSKEDQLTIAQKAKYDSEEQIIENLKNDLEKSRGLVATMQIELESDDGESEETVDLLNPDLIKDIRKGFEDKFAEIHTKVKSLSDLFDGDSLKTVTDKIGQWTILKTEFNKKYEAAKAQAKVNQQQLNQIQATETRITELKRLQMENRNALYALGSPETAYNELRQKWDASHAEKITALDGQCQQFSLLSNGLIKAEINKSLDVESLKQKIKMAFTGMNVREQKIDDLCKCILSASNPLSAWGGVLSELEKLAHFTVGGTDSLLDTPTLSSCGFTENERARIASSFDKEKWLDLSVVELEFNPIFRYCTNQSTNEYIEFADASAGQQATALLTVLLNQQGAPLIIDQPEDDIDSKLIKNIIEQIWKAKTKRQLIFASHNANFVVNGDAELVVCCDYIKTGDQTGGQIKNTGAIDNKNIRDEITNVTEGGRQAFKLRMDKYGF